MKIIIAGGSGFIGRAVIKRLLASQNHVILLTRKTEFTNETGDSKLQSQVWDAQSAGPWKHQLTWADAVINLCGEGIADRRWSPSRKKRLRESRLGPTKTLIQAMSEIKPRPKVFLNASAVGFYGNVPQGDVIESHRKGTGFLADLCEEWEHEASKAESLGVRTVRMRIGLVLEKSGGMLARMLPVFRAGLGGPAGSGSQWIPWIHLEDLVEIMLYALQNPSVSGPLNATGPQPCTMKEFSKTLGRALHRPSGFPVPGFLLKILLGERASLLLEGQRAVPEQLLKLGFVFKHASLEEALIKALA